MITAVVVGTLLVLALVVALGGGAAGGARIGRRYRVAPSHLTGQM